MIRAALLTPNMTLGGAERWVISLVKYADPAKLRWTGVVVSGWGGAEKNLCEEIAAHVPLHCNSVPPSQRLHKRPFDYHSFAGIHPTLPEAVEEVARDADVIVAWGGPDLSAWLPPLKIPVVLTSHTTEVGNGAVQVRGATHLVGVSEAAAKFFNGKQAQPLSVQVIYNGAELDRCQPQAGREAQRRAWNVSDEEVVVGYIGRQSREKNPRAAIEAVAELPSRFKAVYYGEPVSRPGDADLNLPRFAHERAPGRVSFYPPVRELGDILAGLDVFLLASHREACSLAMIEAWLAGTPVVATPVGSLPELQRKFGPLAVEVPINPTAEELAEAVVRAAGAEGQKYAERARQVALDHFTCERMLDRWHEYLARVCS